MTRQLPLELSDHLIEQMLAERAGPGAPDDLVSDISAAIGAMPQRRPWLAPPIVLPRGVRSRLILVAAALVLVALAAGIATVGSYLQRNRTDLTVVPPSPDSTPSFASVSPITPLLGGGLILVQEPKMDDANSVFTLDAGTGERTLLGVLPYRGIGSAGHKGESYNLQWSADRTHVLITQRNPGVGNIYRLESLTDAGRKLSFVCCEQPDTSRWVLSPRGDQIAGLHSASIQVPGQQGTTSRADAIVVTDVDGGNVRNLPLPPGTDARAGPLAWSRDGSTIAVAGCRPCDYSNSGETPTAINHEHLFIVPVDGSPVRDLFDATRSGVDSPSWAADGSSIIVVWAECEPKVPPHCGAGAVHSKIATLDLAESHLNFLSDVGSEATSLAVSPDGRRIAFNATGSVFVMDADGTHVVELGAGFEPHWSPDSNWLLFSTESGDLWIVGADGSEKRRLGSYPGGAW